MTKKYIFNIFFIILFLTTSMPVLAVCDGSPSLISGTCEKDAGCCVETGPATGDPPRTPFVCKVCSVGWYNPGSGKQNCTKPEGAEWQGQVTGQTENLCPWKITCYKDEYWYDGDANVANAGCRTCQSAGKQPHPNNSSETIEGYGSALSFLDFELPPTDMSERCIENDYSIELDASNKNYGKKTLWIKPTVGFANSASADYWSAEPDPSWIIPDIPDNNWWNRPSGGNEYGFTGYATPGTTKYFTGTGELAYGINVNSFYSAIQLTATWQKVYYDVVYYTADGVQHARLDKINIDTRKITGGEKDGEDALADSTGPSMDGKVFSEWTCEVPTTCSNCEQTCSVRTINKNSSLPRPKKDTYEVLYTDISSEHQMNVNLYPRYKDCPAGYYCKNGEQKACPAGTTSDEGSSLITQCYMSTASKTGTLLKDNFVEQIPLRNLAEFNIFYKQN